MTTTSNSLHTRGFRAPVHDAQQVFRSILSSMARPTTPQPVAVDLTPPTPLGAVAAAIVLTLCDEHTPLWLDASLHSNTAVPEWIRFHTGAPVVEDITQATFAVASSPATAPALHDLDPGTDIAPHTSATLIIDIRAAAPLGAPLVATGPGVHGAVTWDGRGAPAELMRHRANRKSGFPQGIDLLFADHDTVSALPRTTHLESPGTGSENP